MQIDVVKSKLLKIEAATVVSVGAAGTEGGREAGHCVVLVLAISCKSGSHRSVALARKFEKS